MVDILPILTTVIMGALTIVVLLYNGAKQRQQVEKLNLQDRLEKVQEKKDNETLFGRTVSNIHE
jgi:hypothetical protein